MAQRPPRVSEHQKEEPDSPGRWLFHGYAVLAGSGTIGEVEVKTERDFLVKEQDGKLLIFEKERDKPYGDNTTWVGWWMKIED